MANKVEIIINADGTRAIKALKDVGATAAATGRASVEASKGNAIAAKYEGDTISAESVKIVKAREQARQASADYAKVLALTRKGYVEEATGVTAAAAAYQKLTEAKLLASKAGGTGEASHEWLSLRERIGGLNLGGSLKEGLGALGLTVGAAEAAAKMKDMVTESLEFGEAMELASKKTGLAVGTLSTLHYAAAVTGGDFDSMTNAVSRMDKVIAQATEGNKTSIAFLQKLGLSAKSLADSPDGAEVAFRKLAATLSATEDPIRRVELASEMFGQRVGAEQIPMLIELGEHWDEYTAKAKAAGVYMDQMNAEQLEQLNRKLKDLQQYILGAGLAFTEGMTPALSAIIGIITSGKSSMDAMNEWGKDMGKTFAFLTEIVYSAASAMETLFGMGEALVPGLGDLARRDLAAASDLMGKADAAHNIAFGPEPTQHNAQDLGKYGLVGFSGERVGTPDPGMGAGGFAGVGDLTKGKDAQKAKFEAMKDALEQQKLLHGASAMDEEGYWQKMLSTAKQGSELYKLIVPEIVKAQQEVVGAFARASVEQAEEAKRLNDQVHDALLKTWDDQNKQDEANRKKAYEMFSSTQASTADKRLQDMLGGDQVRELQLRLAPAGVAARETAAMHTQEYGERRADLDSAMTRASGMPGDTDADIEARKRQTAEIAKQIDELERQHTLQEAEDDARIESTTLMGGLNDALRSFTAEATNAGAAMERWFSGALTTTNSELVKMLTVPAHHAGAANWGQAGHEIFGSAAAGALKYGEGNAMDALGLGGKNDGSSAARALYVRLTDALGGKGSAASAASTLFGARPNELDNASGNTVAKLLGTGSGGATAGSGGGFLSNAAGLLMHLIPGFAEGVDDFGGGLALVGEKGPELLNLPRGSGVTPNGKFGGGDTHLHFHSGAIDTRGSTNPAQTAALVKQGIIEATPHIAAYTMRAQDARNARLPSSRRR